MVIISFSFLGLAGAADELGMLQASFLRGEYERVYHAARELSERGGASADGYLYLQGVSALKLGDLSRARQALNRLLDSHSNSRWAAQAWIALGDSWEAAGEYETALQVYSRTLEQGRDSSMAPQALLRIGSVQRELGRWDEAKRSFQEAASRAPGSPEAAQAAELLRSGEFFFCVQVGAFITPGNADKLRAELARRGYDASVSQAAMNGRMYHRVRVGRFSTRREAEEQARKLQQDGFPAKVFP